MVRVGIVDFDSSHCVEFAKRLNHQGIEEEQWVDGARVVAGWTGPSAITPPERVKEHTRILTEELGVRVVEGLEELRRFVDAAMVLSVDGSVHWERAKPFLEAGMPVFVDKPFASSLSDALRMADLAAKNGAPLFSSSSLRYAPEVQGVTTSPDRWGKILRASTFSPASTHPRNPGFFHYGIHGVEILYALMGKGCRFVSCLSRPGEDIAIGEWDGGRFGIMRGIRQGPHAFGFVAFCEKGVQTTTINIRFIYRELLKRIVTMFQEGKPPLDISETLELIAFIEMANRSAEEGGRVVPVPKF